MGFSFYFTIIFFVFVYNGGNLKTPGGETLKWIDKTDKLTVWTHLDFLEMPTYPVGKLYIDLIDVKNLYPPHHFDWFLFIFF